MLIWILMAVLAAVVALPVLVPLFRGRQAQPMATAAGSIYRDQLAEIERDHGRGLIADGEAEAARTEVARRLLKTSEAISPAAVTAPWRQWSAAAAIIALPVLALGLYVFLGSPGLPDQPLAARLSLPLEKQDPEIIVAQLEAHLASNPDDATGWGFLAQIAESLEHFDVEARAFSNLIRLRGASAELETAYGQALTRANDGVVSKEARAAFEAGNKIDPQAIGPRFFLALARAERGRRPGRTEPRPRSAAGHDQRHGEPARATSGDRSERCGRLGAAGPLLHGAWPQRRRQGGARQGAHCFGRQERPSRPRRGGSEIGRRAAMREIGR